MSKKEYTPKEIQELETLCRALLEGANKCSEAPFYIVQPFMSVVIKHAELINKFKLMDKQHDLWETGDKDIPEAILDSNGEVVLAYCKICGGAESSLPTNCPGRKLTEEEQDKISNGLLNF